MSKEVYFHFGMGKTGTTFLQYRAFPNFKGLQYIQRTRFASARQIIEDSEEQQFFISFECDQQLESVARAWAKDYPQTHPILVFRQHDSWIASQYRRFVKNCHVRSFEEMLDLKHDKGRFKQSDLKFFPMIELLDELFEHKTLVLLYEDMRKHPKSFITLIADYLGAQVDLESIDYSSKHSSYSARQLRFLMRVGKHIDLQKRVVYSNKVIEFIRKWCVNGTRYLILWLGKWVPGKHSLGGALMDGSDRDKVRTFYNEDWQKVCARANSLTSKS